MTSRNQTLFDLSQQVIPAGVNSPVRAFRSVGGTPVFIKRAQGSRIWDADGKEYIDYVGSWGPMVLGHAHPDVIAAVQLARGFTGRSKIIKFEGCYHGHADALLVKAGSGALTFGQPSSAGVPPEVVAHTLVLDFNDSEGLT